MPSIYHHPHLTAKSQAGTGVYEHHLAVRGGTGYRLVYRVEDERIVILVLAIGKRERGSVYEHAEKR